MAITLGSSGITFADGSSQTSTASYDRGRPISIVTFTSNGTYYVPAKCSTILVQIVGGGGGSASATAGTGGSGVGGSKRRQAAAARRRRRCARSLLFGDTDAHSGIKDIK